MTSSLLLIKVSATDIFPDPVFLSLCNIWLFASYLDRERGKLRHPAPGCFLSHYFRKLTTRFHIFYFLSLLMQYNVYCICLTVEMENSSTGCRLSEYFPSVLLPSQPPCACQAFLTSYRSYEGRRQKILGFLGLCTKSTPTPHSVHSRKSKVTCCRKNRRLKAKTET